MAFTVRPTQEEEEMLEKLKSELGMKMTTQAVLKAAHYYVKELPHLQFERDILSKELIKLQGKFKRLKDALLVKESTEWSIKRIIKDAE